MPFSARMSASTSSRQRPPSGMGSNSTIKPCQKMRTMVNPTQTSSMPRATGINQPSERTAMAKKGAAKRRPWNKGLEMGQKDAFTPAQVKRIRQVLVDRGVPGLRDLALFSLAIDTMLQGRNYSISLLKTCGALTVRFAQLLRSHAQGESRRSDAPCPRQRQARLESGLPCRAKSAQNIFSLGVAPDLLVR